MNDTSMNTMKLKHYNRNSIYNLIFTEKRSCKQMITNGLGIGLTTVIQNLKQLEAEGLIQKNGYFDSTGGRKADAVEIVKEARITIGVAILKSTVYIVACNLYGEPIHQKAVTLTFENNPSFYTNLANNIRLFTEENALDPQIILGVSVAVQGIVSADSTQVIYGKILDNLGMNLVNLSKLLPYKCRLEHDSKSAGELELWKNPHITDGIVLLLNQNMGGTVITNGKVLKGENMRSGIVEHMRLFEDGATCYCGQKGCAETVCSAGALEQTVNMPLEDFFTAISNQDPKAQNHWRNYLDNLAMVIQKLSVVIDGYFVISGYLAPYFTDDDTSYLLYKINENLTFPLNPEQIILTNHENEKLSPKQYGKYTQAIGASLFYIKEFLSEI